MKDHWFRYGSDIGWFVKIVVRIADIPLGVVGGDGEADK